MSDEDILKTVANELKANGNFNNICHLMPYLRQSIEKVLEKNKELETKYLKALNDLVRAEKEKNKLEEEINKINQHKKSYKKI